MIWASVLALLAEAVGLIMTAPNLGSGMVEVMMLLMAGALFIAICAIEARH